jgi:dihydroxyacetone kinase-like predicted kinase
MAAHCYDFRKGYVLKPRFMKHESADQYKAFQDYLRMGGNRSFDPIAKSAQVDISTVRNWAKKYNWEKRAAQWDKEQVALTWKNAEKMREQKHKRSIIEFRDASERQARMMMEISEDLLCVLTKRVKDAQDRGEEVPLPLVSGLLRATANITEQSRQAWASALGVEDMLQLVEQELERVQVEDITDEDDEDYIELDE